MAPDNRHGGPLGAFVTARSLPRSVLPREVTDGVRGAPASPRTARHRSSVRIDVRLLRLARTWTHRSRRRHVAAAMLTEAVAQRGPAS